MAKRLKEAAEVLRELGYDEAARVLMRESVSGEVRDMHAVRVGCQKWAVSFCFPDEDPGQINQFVACRFGRVLRDLTMLGAPEPLDVDVWPLHNPEGRPGLVVSWLWPKWFDPAAHRERLARALDEDVKNEGARTLLSVVAGPNGPVVASRRFHLRGRVLEALGESMRREFRAEIDADPNMPASVRVTFGGETFDIEVR